MWKRLGFATSVIGVLMGMAAAPAQAAPIVGTISFAGNGGPLGSADWYDSTGVDFTNPWIVIGDSGDYSGVPTLFSSPAVTFTDFSWGAGSGAVNVPLSQTIWALTYGGSTYTLTAGAVTNIDRGDATNNNISVNGTGTLTISGAINRDATAGTFNFTGGFAPQTGAPNLSFSSGALAAVPEPASMMLLGSGLVGLAGAARRRARKKA